MSIACSTVKMTDKNGDLNFLGQEATQWRDIPKEPIEYAPKKVKLSVVGNGSASKEQVQYMVKSILSLKQLSEKFDVTDALAVALCHINQLRSPVK